MTGSVLVKGWQVEIKLRIPLDTPADPPGGRVSTKDRLRSLHDHRRRQLSPERSPGTGRTAQGTALEEKAAEIIPMEPNDLPIVVLPLDLSDDSAAILIDFLRDLTAALERHYAGQLLRRQQSIRQSQSKDPPDGTADTDPPF